MSLNRLFSLLLVLPILFGYTPQLMAEDHFFLHFLQREKPHVSQDPCVEKVAKEIDYLEAMIETYGTIVPKHPDVWGEARLTKHRQEVERELAKDLGGFQETLNASLRRSDQSYLSAALTIDAAANGASAPSLQNEIDFVAIPEGAIQRSEAGGLKHGSFGTSSSDQELNRVSLEPTVVLEQKFRYLNYLNELRRINEGDDTADSPGYSLNLVRVPISILPGKKTQAGFGAEVTITAESHLAENLLPTTFRNLVINDIVDTLGLPGRKIMDDKELIEAAKALVQLKSTYGRRQNFDDQSVANALRISLPEWEQAKAEIQVDNAPTNNGRSEGSQKKGERPTDMQVDALDAYDARFKSFVAETLTGSIATGRSSQSQTALSPLEVFDAYGDVPLAVVAVDAAEALEGDPVNSHVPHLADIESYLTWELNTAYEFLSREETQFLWSHCSPELVEAIRQRRRLLPRKHFDQVETEILATRDTNPRIEKLRSAFFNDIRKHYPRATFSTTASLSWCIIVNAALLNDRLLHDMQVVGDETGEFVAPGQGIWVPFFLPTPGPDAVHLFGQYVQARWPIHVFALDPVTDEQNIAEVFSQRREMQLALAAGVASGNVNARSAMNFARRLELDIETIDLNRKAVAFAHGQNVFGWRFYPRFQSPPVPSTLGAFVQTTIGIGQSDRALIKDSRLEPGIREVTAVVLMPSFVSHVTFDSRANWFKLTNPRHKELTMHDSMQISKAWQSIASCMPQLRCPENYRAEDVAWLTKAIDQIEHRLPLQSMLVPVPYENTLGGFEMFNSGITDLAPSLRGWYGAPGITTLGESVGCSDGAPISEAGVPNYGGPNAAGTCFGTTLFLVGSNYSVHDTRVLAGGRSIPFQLISRRIMQVTIPPNVTTLTENLPNGSKRKVVDVHVATPYGVSNHMLIPTSEPRKEPEKKEKPPGFYWKKTEFQAFATAHLVDDRLRYEAVFAPYKLSDLNVVNHNGTPSPMRARLVGLVFIDGTTHLGQTREFDVELEDQSGLLETKTIDGNSFLDDVAGLLSEHLTKHVDVNTTARKVTVRGYLLIDQWPPIALIEPLSIELTIYPPAFHVKSEQMAPIQARNTRKTLDEVAVPSHLLDRSEYRSDFTPSMQIQPIQRTSHGITVLRRLPIPID